MGANNQIRLDCLLNANKTSEFCSPLTSCDWNETDLSMVGVSSIDSTCTIWDVKTMQSKTLVIAHDREAYDFAFAAGVHIFASVGADGSLRMFDLRSLKHSTVIYETQGGPAGTTVPLIRLAWNKQDPNYIATLQMDSNAVTILDIRVPSVAMATLEGHNHCVNAIAWAPHSSSHICSVGDDNQALIWDLYNMQKPVEGPILAFTAGSEVNNLQWPKSQPDWVAVCFDNQLQVLRV